VVPIFTPPQGDELGKDVARSVMQAAVDPEKDPCDGVGNKNSKGFETTEYNWTTMSVLNLFTTRRREDLRV